MTVKVGARRLSRLQVFTKWGVSFSTRFILILPFSFGPAQSARLCFPDSAAKVQHPNSGVVRCTRSFLQDALTSMKDPHPQVETEFKVQATSREPDVLTGCLC
ncbi:hypothetical protein A6X21_11790 [Planctopirus hydrillae]|uniref:Uncharacterized protein n=1 Tax=Planctopirus hydrillae TaxID=1841610 RepID=A0A1C3E583_9PLAN|nr:hypothetical protein A6X21_11790 [Planctopirus hydrillae]